MQGIVVAKLPMLFSLLSSSCSFLGSIVHLHRDLSGDLLSVC